ncbi:TetR/AcrR family transcriptional regulator [Yinghuangia soli]|uniref:TetR/AcrR family transcriptional regulator n=1 Tax=Yinghuangia soli TaxID=2908204 RepID=A0AA41PX00_9ACTN|nr:TetR/AcrR family transcriptional regulator [Yinghuangia soli]MCF2527389.1 TetR/AcrR family transcriptional regulator [Yinghuangia soli]
MTTGESPRKRGRQAEAARNDLRVLAAAREVFSTLGADAPVSAVAERAGVGIASLYRRYGTKEELLQRLCVLAADQYAEAARAALEVPDPWDGFAHYVRACVDFGPASLAPVAGTVAFTAEMAAAGDRADRLADEVVARAHRAGVLRPDATTIDVFAVIEQFARRPPVPTGEDPNVRARLVALLLDGLRSRAGEPDPPLPGHAPTMARYAELWRSPEA